MSVPELPVLESGVYCLEPDATRPRRRRRALLSSLHALALDAALSAGGDVVWIDAQGHATTHVMASVAPSGRALERVHVARAFTTHQHHALVEQVARWLALTLTPASGREGPFGSPATDRPAVLVCPALDALYRAGELRDDESQALLVRALAVLAAAARDHDLAVLLTRTRTDEFAAPIADAATTIGLERTRFGPRFECEALEFETLVYPVDDGVVQTTFAFWRAILETRHPGIADAGGDDASRPTSTVPAGPGAGGG